MRSGVVVTAVSLGVFAGVFTMAFMRGMANDRLESAIKTETSHIQLHNPEYLNVNDIENFFPDSDRKMKEIRGLTGVESVSRRLIINSIISSAEKGGGVRLIGVEPDNEKKVTNLNEKIINGNYLEPLKRGDPIVIGEKLAEKLAVRTGSKVVLGMLDIDGQPFYHQFRISGVFQTPSAPFDEFTAFVRYEDLLTMTRLPENAAHEIAIYTTSEDMSGEVADRLKSMYPELSVQEWFEIMPELGYLTASMDFYMYIFILIILLALGFGIVNTMLMVVLERIKELGMLMAVGMNKTRIFLMIMLETVFLSLTGGVIGIFLGAAFSKYFHARGMDLSGLYKEGLEALGWDTVVHTEIHVDMVVIVTLLVILTGIAASVYPALKALKLNPSEAIRTDN